MKTVKILLVLVTLSFSICTGSYSVAAPKIKISKEALFNYVQYITINGELWKITYSDDGVVLSQERVFD